MKKIRKNKPALLLTLCTSCISVMQEAKANTSVGGQSPASSPQKTSADRILRAKGTIRDADAPGEGPLFHIEYEHIEKAGVAQSTIIRQTDLLGQLVASEDTRYDERGLLKSYALEQLQAGIQARVDIKDGKVLLNWNEKGKTKTASDTASKNTVAAGSLMAYMSNHIAQLTQGQSINLRLALPEQATTFNFRLVPQKQACSKEAQDFCVDLVMSNFFLNKFVKPVRMTFQKSPEGYRPLNLVTPSVVLKKKGDKLEKFTAVIEYPRL